MISSTLLVLASVAISSATYCPPTWGYQDPDGLNAAITVASAVVTLTVPGVDSSIASDVLALFPGILASDGFIQPVTARGDSSYCGAEDGNNWCASAVRYASSGQISGPGVSVAEGTQLVLTIDNNLAGNVTQTVATTDGQVLSTLSTNSSDLYSFMLSIEWQGNVDATMPAVSWSDLTLKFSSSNPNFASSIVQQYATVDGFGTTDDGTTWVANSIDFSAQECQAQN